MASTRKNVLTATSGRSTAAPMTIPSISARTRRRLTPSERAERITEAMGVAPFPSTFFRRDMRLSSGR